jgi:hypothetical protein
MRHLVGIATTLAVLACVSPAAAQSLGEIAKREADRRKQTAAGRLYTNSDVRPEAKPSVVQTPVAVAASLTAAAPEPAQPEDKGSAAAAGTTADAAPVRAKEHRDETYWRTRARELRGHIQRLRDDVTAIETRQLELGEQPDAAPEYEVATDALTKLRRNLDSFTGELARFEERARAANVPAEWIR